MFVLFVFFLSGISALAECLNCPELKVAADDFIHQHFTDVYKMDEFLQLDVKQVTYLLQQDTLTVRAEDQVRPSVRPPNTVLDVLHALTDLTSYLHTKYCGDDSGMCVFVQIYDAAVRWLKYDVLNRQQYIVDILGKVRFPLVSKNFLSKTVQAEPLIQDNPECLKMVICKLT